MRSNLQEWKEIGEVPLSVTCEDSKCASLSNLPTGPVTQKLALMVGFVDYMFVKIHVEILTLHMMGF